MRDIAIHSGVITLQQLLKKIDLIASGGEAKLFLSTEKVFVNGVAENRRGKKLVPGDLVRVGQQTVRLVAE